MHTNVKCSVGPLVHVFSADSVNYLLQHSHQASALLVVDDEDLDCFHTAPFAWFINTIIRKPAIGSSQTLHPLLI